MDRQALDLEEIYFAAGELGSPGERAAYLDEVCGPDADLRRRVERLLAARQRVGDFLDAPAAGPTVSLGVDPAPEGAGTAIGPYKLMEQIGEGGMGVVYVAEQAQPVRRKVALKVIKPGMDTRQVIARFEAERQALAMMDHPNIARILDGGTTASGRPYFVMELVRGLPITDYCDRERLAIPERLELFVLVCRAVQHAHQKGIIHRDLKPSNILVTVIDGAAVPKVIDFGVAKATGASLTERTIYTAFHQFVGTPLYMSPEQADVSGMDTDTRSDIYSLGVLLYELLTGTTPFDRETFGKAAFDEMRRIIREEEPPKPSTRLSSLGATRTNISANRRADARHLDRSVRGELDWIVMKSLEKDRRRRYETANDFADDVMNYLTDRPVGACPPSARYRLGKFARRNRAMLTTATLILVIVMLALVGLSIGLMQVARERNRAVLLQRQAEERAQGVVLEAIKMDEAIAAASLRGDLRFEPWQRQFIERLLTVFEKYVRDFGNHQDARYETAVVYLRLGRIQQYLGRPEIAEAHFRRALPLWEALARELPVNPDCLVYRAGCLMNVANCVGALDREPYLRRALLFNEQLVDRFPEYLTGHVQLATCLLFYGKLIEDAGRPDQAEVYYRRALPIFVRLMVEPLEEPQPLLVKYLLPKMCPRLESVLTATGRPVEVDAVYGEALALLEAQGPVSGEMQAIVRNQWAWSLITRTDVAPRQPRRAVELARGAVVLVPKNASIWRTLGVAHYRVGDWKAAITALEKAEALAPDKNLGVNGFFLAMAQWRHGEEDQARRWYDKAAAWMDEHQPQDDKLKRFRAEAEALLGVKQTRREPPQRAGPDPARPPK